MWMAIDKLNFCASNFFLLKSLFYIKQLRPSPA
uniref:Uncharacterized protein n=1 Tax=Rhizophora mucronata TaxID=61149 RepID=A0A2P2N810_RHIMU